MGLPRRPIFYGLCLVLGALLFGVAGLNHPRLTGDGAAQLETIVATEWWRTIHWALLFGLPLMYVGLAGVTLRHHETPGSAPARAAILLAAFAFAVWAYNILFMVGAGWQLARAYTAADTGLTGTHAVFIYDMLHPAGLAAERLATFTLGLVAYVFGWAVLSGRVYPRALGWAAFGVSLVCTGIGVGFGEFSFNQFVGQGLFVTWLFALGVAMLSERRNAPSPSSA
jgi:hypothetical protein